MLIKYLGILENKLHSQGKKIKNIIIDGLCTDICVITNVLTIKTFFPECNIQLLYEVTAASMLINQQAALDIMLACQVELISL